jgi:hypothetical protein
MPGAFIGTATMTNATVTGAVESQSGRDLNLSYKGGSVKVMVPPDAPVVTPRRFPPPDPTSSPAHPSSFAQAMTRMPG